MKHEKFSFQSIIYITAILPVITFKQFIGKICKNFYDHHVRTGLRIIPLKISKIL